MPAPTTIFQYWDDADVPHYMDALLDTFREHNPEMRHALFDEARAGELIEHHYTPRHVAAFRACAVPAMRADYFRYCAVHAFGGIYCDADHRCAEPLDTLLDGCRDARLFRHDNGAVVNGFFGFRSPGHPLLALALEIATSNIENKASEQVWITTGPAIFTSLFRLLESGSIDAFVERSPTLHKGNLVPIVDSLSTVAKDVRRVAAAVEGVTVSPIAQGTRWVTGAGRDLPYKRTTAHWLGFGPSIYR